MASVFVRESVPAGLGDNGSQPAATQSRLESVDLLRGVVMILMALDHTRDFVSNTRFNLLDLSQTNAAWFLTRWVTHLCAPTFVFLAGTGAFLSGSRGRTRPQVAWFLLSRGLWLVFLEFTLVQFGWFFQIDYHLLLAQVIWAIGCSMVVLSGLVFLPLRLIAVLGLALIAGHNLFDALPPDRLGQFAEWWKILDSGGIVRLRPDVVLLVVYPILPWLGIMLVGYSLGAVWLLDRVRRRRWLVAMGTGTLVLFVVLRAINRYGDPQPWSPQSTGLFTLLSFVNCQKYPPSLLFTLMTLGPALLLLGWWDRAPGRLGRVCVTFGRVPLFYYLLHIPLIHLVALLLAYVRYAEVGFMLQNLAIPRTPLPADYGYGLPGVYAIWLAVVLLLYPVCAWYAEFKRRRRPVWLSYL